MNKLKRIFSICFAVVFTLCLSVSVFGCKDKEANSDGKYDVTIRIACDDGGSWVFPPDVEEIRIERYFDGEEHRYYIDAYQLPDRPGGKDRWISPAGEGANVFDSSYGKVNQRYDEEDPKSICEKGEYYFYVRATDTSNLWNARTVRLYITVI